MHLLELDLSPLGVVLMASFSVLLSLLFGLLHHAQWVRGESRSGGPSDVGIHGWKLPSSGSRSRKTSAVQSLVLKELYLQTPAIFTTGASIVLAVVGEVVGHMSEPWSDLKAVSMLVQVAIVPLLIGCTAVAEERALQSHQLMATLTRTWRSMFAIKLVTGGALVLLLSVLSPMLILATLNDGLSNSSGKQVLLPSGFLWAAGLFAGSLTKGTTKAMLLACGVCAMILGEWISWRFLADSVLKGSDGRNPVANLLLSFQEYFPALSLSAFGESAAVGILLTLYFIPLLTVLIGVSASLGRWPHASFAQRTKAFALLIGVTAPLSAVMQESLRLMNLF